MVASKVAIVAAGSPSYFRAAPRYDALHTQRILREDDFDQSFVHQVLDKLGPQRKLACAVKRECGSIYIRIYICVLNRVETHTS